MKLYHGSNMAIDAIDLNRGRRGKDFGRGFYLSADLDQALMMAERTVAREETGTPTITTYEFDDSIIHSPTDLNIKTFDGYTRQWAEFIMMNRRNKSNEQVHNFDIVYGPIADDKVGLQISRYQMQYISMQVLVKQLSFMRPTFQFFFGTERAICLLHKI